MTQNKKIRRLTNLLKYNVTQFTIDGPYQFFNNAGIEGKQNLT